MTRLRPLLSLPVLALVTVFGLVRRRPGRDGGTGLGGAGAEDAAVDHALDRAGHAGQRVAALPAAATGPPGLAEPQRGVADRRHRFAHDPPTGQTLAESVLVPYPIGSALSGIQRHEDRMWYRKTFTVPVAWSGRRVQLNFGAATWQATVWVNGQQAGTHSGGYDAFSFDITGALCAGANEVIVGVYSPVDSAGIPIGTQRRAAAGSSTPPPAGCGRPCGWSRPRPPTPPGSTPPDVPAGVLDLVVQGVGDGTATAQVRTGSASGAVGSHLRVPVPNDGSGVRPTRSATTCG